jgi:BirA family biotin operon repressor/biotin-[acetyl-CoA-carboxylase] ligase
LSSKKSRKGPDRTETALRALIKSRGFLSGSELSQALGISRAALWKRISVLRQRGFAIEARPGRGYRLAACPDLSPELLRISLRGDLGREIIYRNVIASTNDLAMDLASKGGAHGTVILADGQSGGRGRLGRNWHSPTGSGLYMSILLRPDLSPRDATLLMLAGAVSCANAIRDLTGLDAGIKWPNDIVVSGRKLGGILLETRSEPDRINACVVGIGINVNAGSGDFPRRLRTIATSVFLEAGKRIDRTSMAAAILDGLSTELRVLRGSGRTLLLEKWKGLSITLGRKVKVITGETAVTGMARDIDREGRLLLTTRGGRTRKISSGDLTTTMQTR